VESVALAVSVAPEELVESAALAVSVGLVDPVESEGPAALVALAVRVASEVLVVAIARPSCRQVAVPGSTIHNTAEEPPIATARPRTGSAGLRAAIRLPIAKTRLGNKSVVRAAM